MLSSPKYHLHEVVDVSNHSDDVINGGVNCLGSGASKISQEIGLVNHSQKPPEPKPEPELVIKSEPEPEPVIKSGPEPKPKPELVIKSDKLITCESMKKDDCILSRDEECPICLEDYTDENPMITTKCLHCYHLGCIYDWQERSGQCPICLGVMEFQEIN